MPCIVYIVTTQILISIYRFSFIFVSIYVYVYNFVSIYSLVRKVLALVRSVSGFSRVAFFSNISVVAKDHPSEFTVCVFLNHFCEAALLLPLSADSCMNSLSLMTP